MAFFSVSPSGAQRGQLLLLIGQLFAQGLQPIAAGPVFLFLERGLLDLQLHHPAGDLVEFGGIESISVRIIAQDSSIRSIALSGRKRSVM